jgi:hypothetical protein
LSAALAWKGVITSGRVSAVLLALVVGALIHDYPVFRIFLVAFLLVYGMLMLRWPLVWLAVLPASVPLLQLAHWSGRLYVEDIDIVFLFTFAVLLWRKPSVTSVKDSSLPLAAHLALFSLFVSYLISLTIALYPWPVWNRPDVLASFLSPANSLRLAKGFFWAMLLSPFVLEAFKRDRIQSQRMIVVGMVVGGLTTGVMALWERGVWHALISGRDIYQVLSSILDFSTAYRVTGTFAEMHTGGEAIDGYLGLVWPIALLALLLSRRPLTLAASGLVFSLVFYSLVTTFSRGLYLSLVVAGGLWLAGLFLAFRRSRQFANVRHIGPLLLLLGASMVVMAFGFSKGGMMTLVSALLMLLVAVLLPWRSVSLGSRWIILVGTLAFCFWFAARGMLTSKWNPLELDTATIIAAFLVAVMAALGHLMGRLLPRGLGSKPYVVLAVVVTIGAGSLIPALLGYRMTERLSDSLSDFSTRSDHWGHVLALRNGHFLDQAFGMGLGSFPREYHWDNLNRPEGSGNFSLLREEGNTFLRTTGGKDLRIGQRLSLDAMEPVQLRMRARILSPEARLKIRLCRRFVIHPTEWNSQCVTVDHTIPGNTGEWQQLAFDLDPLRIGDGLEFGRAPLMLEINNRREYRLMSQPPAIVDLDDIMLVGSRDNSHLENGGFERGMDRWLPYYDFNHLPWHVKNLWLHLYFEQGALGVIAFAATWLIGLWAGFRAISRGEIFPIGVAAAVTGFVAVGTFGSPIDAPRVAWLYYFLLFVLMAHYRAAALPGIPRSSRMSPASSGDDSQ